MYNFWGHECRKNDFDLFWLQRRSKCLDWNETRTWRMTRPTKCIYQVWNWHLKIRRKKAEKSKTRKTNRQNYENTIYARLGTLVEKDAAGHLCTKCEEFILIDEAMIAKNMFGLLLAESQTRHIAPPTECIYKVSYWYLKACWKVRKMRTEGRTEPQNGVLWLLLSINLGAFFLCGYWVLCGCVCMSRPTKRCLVATFVHKFGCLFSCVAFGFCVAANKQDSHKSTNCTKK